MPPTQPFTTSQYLDPSASQTRFAAPSQRYAYREPVAPTAAPAPKPNRLVLRRAPGDEVYGKLVLQHEGEQLTIEIGALGEDGCVDVVFSGPRAFRIQRAELLLQQAIDASAQELAELTRDE